MLNFGGFEADQLVNNLILIEPHDGVSVDVRSAAVNAPCARECWCPTVASSVDTDLGSFLEVFR